MLFGLSAPHLLPCSHSTFPGIIKSCPFRSFLGLLDSSHSPKSAKPIYAMIQVFIILLSSILSQSPHVVLQGDGGCWYSCVWVHSVCPNHSFPTPPLPRNSDTFWPQCSSSPPLLPLNIAWDHQILSVWDILRLIGFILFT